MPELTAKMH